MRFEFFVLPIRRAEILLGVQWLEALGPVLTDYRSFSMQFQWKDKWVQLWSDRSSVPQQINLHLINRTSAKTPFSSPIPAPIQPLIQSFQSIFQKPTYLLTDCLNTNICSLTPNLLLFALTVIPYFQKNEIEKQVQDLLSAGLMQYSTGSFSSPILFVKKKDGTWRFCVDYRAFNHS